MGPLTIMSSTETRNTPLPHRTCLKQKFAKLSHKKIRINKFLDKLPSREVKHNHSKFIFTAMFRDVFVHMRIDSVSHVARIG